MLIYNPYTLLPRLFSPCLTFFPRLFIQPLASDDPIAAVVVLVSAQQSCPSNVDEWLHEVGVLAPNQQLGQLPTLTDELKSSCEICSLSERVDSMLM
ncbi:hypothetical protein EMIT047CA2_90154 [Pseudomonas soli]